MLLVCPNCWCRTIKLLVSHHKYTFRCTHLFTNNVGPTASAAMNLKSRYPSAGTRVNFLYRVRTLKYQIYMFCRRVNFFADA